MVYWALFITPKKLLSRLVGTLADYPFPKRIQFKILKWFSNRYSINLSESDKPLEEFLTLNDLFTRKLKSGVRSIGDSFYVHPADSVIMASGLSQNGVALQIKKVPYSLAQLLPGFNLSNFDHGYYGLYYLCPTDYHRVHSPVEGEVISITHVPGLLWPVNEWSSRSIVGLFYKNERVIIEIQTSRGSIALTLVAATNVGQVSLSFDPEFRARSLSAKKLWKKNYTHTFLKKGDELGIFHMGSTVVVLTSNEFQQKCFLNLPVAIRVQVGQEVTG